MVQIITGGGLFGEPGERVPVKLSKEQRRRYVERHTAETRAFLGTEETMTPEQKYEAIYQADLQAMGGKLSVSKDEYIASLRATDAGGDIQGFAVNSSPDANTAPQASNTNHFADAKYRKQYQADLALLGRPMNCTEDEYIRTLKINENGGELSLH